MVDPSGYLQIGAATTTLAPNPHAAQAEFATARSLVARDAIAPDVLAGLIRMLGRSAFRSDMVDQMGHREIETPETTGTAITLLLRRAPLFRWLEAVSGCGPIAGIAGRVVQTHARPGDELIWHDDTGAEVRRLGVTVALDSPPYEGGAFELRRVGDTQLLRRFVHDSPGTMLVFEVGTHLEHRVLPLASGGPRRVYTGWFLG